MCTSRFPCMMMLGWIFWEYLRKCGCLNLSKRGWREVVIVVVVVELVEVELLVVVGPSLGLGLGCWCTVARGRAGVWRVWWGI